MGSKITTLPRLSARAMGLAGTPPMAKVSICSSGKARPIPSPSTTGRPSCRPQMSGFSALDPPISPIRSAASGAPVCASNPRMAQMNSSPCSSFSLPTVGAPMAPMEQTKPSSGTSSASITWQGTPRCRSSRSNQMRPM